MSACSVVTVCLSSGHGAGADQAAPCTEQRAAEGESAAMTSGHMWATEIRRGIGATRSLCLVVLSPLAPAEAWLGNGLGM